MILSDPEWQAVLLSLKVSSLAVVLAYLWDFYLMAAGAAQFPGKALLDSIIHLPLVLPPVVVGYLLLIAMGRRGFIGSWLYDWFGLTLPSAGAGGAGGGGDVLSADGAGHSPGAGRGGRQAGTGGANPGGPLAGVFYDNAAADAAGHYRRYRAGLRPLAGEFGATITFVSNIPGKRAPFLRRCIP
jgi:molybdate transport system permease protein